MRLFTLLSALTGLVAAAPPPTINLVPTPAPFGAFSSTPAVAFDVQPKYPTAIPQVSTYRMVPSEYFMNLDSINEIDCGNKGGTAEVIGRDTVLTAFHVVDGNLVCTIGKDVAQVIYANKSLDIAVLHVDTHEKQYYEIDCNGFQKGKTYYAIGFGEAAFIVNKVKGTDRYEDHSDSRSGQPFPHIKLLVGNIYHGMSGGPILNEDGQIVGINNASNDAGPNTLSRELKDTFLCKKD